MTLLEIVFVLVISCLVVYIIFREAKHRRKIEELSYIVAEQKNKVIISEEIVIEQKREIRQNLDKISKYSLHIDALTAQTRDQIVQIAELNKAINHLYGSSKEMLNEIALLKAEDIRKTALLAKFNQK